MAIFALLVTACMPAAPELGTAEHAASTNDDLNTEVYIEEGLFTSPMHWPLLDLGLSTVVGESSWSFLGAPTMTMAGIDGDIQITLAFRDGSTVKLQGHIYAAVTGDTPSIASSDGGTAVVLTASLNAQIVGGTGRYSGASGQAWFRSRAEALRTKQGGNVSYTLVKCTFCPYVLSYVLPGHS
jgi:hypothetical protein